MYDENVGCLVALLVFAVGVLVGCGLGAVACKLLGVG
jgi:hypothetical protein